MARPGGVFCEVCGRRAPTTASAKGGERRLPRGYAWCNRCGVLACAHCRRDVGCAACAEAAARAEPSVVRAARASLPAMAPAPAALVALGLGLVVLALSLALPNAAPEPPTGEVLDLQPAPSASGGSNVPARSAPIAALRVE